jgi:hypothetical protein
MVFFQKKILGLLPGLLHYYSNFISLKSGHLKRAEYMRVKRALVQVNQGMSQHHSLHVAQYGLNSAGHMWTCNIMTPDI